MKSNYSGNEHDKFTPSTTGTKRLLYPTYEQTSNIYASFMDTMKNNLYYSFEIYICMCVCVCLIMAKISIVMFTLGKY